MVVTSAGLLMYHLGGAKINVFLVNPGGPYFVGKDAWGIPKGEIDTENGEDGSDLLAVAIREFEEETGLKVKKGEKFISLGFLKRREGKIVHVWAFKGTGKEKFIGSNKFKMEWPAGSGDIGEFFEIDKGKYFDLNSARKKIHKYQIGFLDRLEDGVVAELNSIRKPAQAKLV